MYDDETITLRCVGCGKSFEEYRDDYEAGLALHVCSTCADTYAPYIAEGNRVALAFISDTVYMLKADGYTPSQIIAWLEGAGLKHQQ